MPTAPLGLGPNRALGGDVVAWNPQSKSTKHTSSGGSMHKGCVPCRFRARPVERGGSRAPTQRSWCQVVIRRSMPRLFGTDSSQCQLLHLVPFRNCGLQYTDRPGLNVSTDLERLNCVPALASLLQILLRRRKTTQPTSTRPKNAT